MSKATLAADVAALANITPAQAETAINTVMQQITFALAHGDDVTIQDFGVFSTLTLPARRSVNPRTHAVITIPAEVYARFYAATALRVALN